MFTVFYLDQHEFGTLKSGGVITEYSLILWPEGNSDSVVACNGLLHSALVIEDCKSFIGNLNTLDCNL